MGLSKRLTNEQLSFETVGSGGSSGWQAPEQLISRSGGAARQTSSVDVFAFGLLLHFCLTAGRHPFGEQYERDANILQRRLTLRHASHLPEAADLIRGCCAPQGERRLAGGDWLAVPPVPCLAKHWQTSSASPKQSLPALPSRLADPDRRPSMQSVMAHPVWWASPKRLAFLIVVSDRVEGEDRAVSGVKRAEKSSCCGSW